MLDFLCLTEILLEKSWITTQIQFYLTLTSILLEMFYCMHECLSTHGNPSVQNKSYVSLKPVNLKHFYIKPYLTHETEIKFTEAEIGKLRQTGILC